MLLFLGGESLLAASELRHGVGWVRKPERLPKPQLQCTEVCRTTRTQVSASSAMHHDCGSPGDTYGSLQQQGARRGASTKIAIGARTVRCEMVFDHFAGRGDLG